MHRPFPHLLRDVIGDIPNRAQVDLLVGEERRATTGGSRMTFDLPGWAFPSSCSADC